MKRVRKHHVAKTVMYGYSKEHDAFFDPETNEWTEDTCGDESCEFCVGRPERPVNS